jgi:hypothetical protein
MFEGSSQDPIFESIVYDENIPELLNGRSKRREDDSTSFTGTEFNEPWDSNTWENLLDLARFGDQSSYTTLRSSSSFRHG